MIEGELGAFLRNRREAVSPADVGLPHRVRRRTPGLRRSELATLAGVSVDYLIRLEQGRDTHPSAQVLAALAEALRLDDHDLDHLRRLSAITHLTELCPRPRQPSRAVRATVRLLLEQLEPAPAFVVNPVGDLLAWTDAYELLMGPPGILDHDDPNLLWFTFSDERAKSVYADWDDVADDQVADLHTAHCSEPDVNTFADRLAAAGGAAFTDRWARVAPPRNPTGVRGIVHPTVGLLRLSFETLELPGADPQHLVVYLAADAATAAGLDRLVGREPGALRAVSAGARAVVTGRR